MYLRSQRRTNHTFEIARKTNLSDMAETVRTEKTLSSTVKTTLRSFLTQICKCSNATDRTSQPRQDETGSSGAACQGLGAAGDFNPGADAQISGEDHRIFFFDKTRS